MAGKRAPGSGGKTEVLIRCDSKLVVHPIRPKDLHARPDPESLDFMRLAVKISQ